MTKIPEEPVFHKEMNQDFGAYPQQNSFGFITEVSTNRVINSSTYWEQKWSSGGFYLARRQNIHELICQASTEPIRSMLDIGCGYAIEAGLIQARFGTELYLMDGDSAWSNGSRYMGFETAETMNFYHTIDHLKNEWRRRGLDFTFVSAIDPDLPHGLNFDLIYSGKSCGFHYPLATHKKTIMKHSGSGTRVIIDLKDGVDQGEVEYEIIDVLLEERLSKTCEIRILR